MTKFQRALGVLDPLHHEFWKIVEILAAELPLHRFKMLPLPISSSLNADRPGPTQLPSPHSAEGR